VHDLLRRSTRSIKRGDDANATENLSTRLRAELEALYKVAEGVVVQRRLDDNLRGVPPSKALARYMAEDLLRERGGGCTDKSWFERFIKRTPELQTKWSRPYDRQRATCEDPAVIRR
jgi:hypothetical protein